MSSILDALNKVEREQIEEDEIVNGEVDAATAARYLYGNASRRRRERAKRRLYRSKAALGVIGLIVLMAVVAAVTASVTIGGTRLPFLNAGVSEGLAPRQETPSVTVEPPPAALPGMAEPQSPAGEAVTAGDLGITPVPAAHYSTEPSTEAPRPVDLQPARPSAAMDPLSQSPSYAAPRAPALNVAEPAPHAPQGMARHAVIPGAPHAVPQEMPPRQEADAAPPSGAEALPEDMNIRTLPRLTPSEQARLGLPRLEVRLVGMPSARRQPSAMINFNKVYVDEFIPNTNVRLVAVDIYGVAVEHDGRFYFLAVRG